MSEGAVQNAIRLALGRIPDAAFFRNNTGVAEFFKDGDIQRVRYGLMVGSADLIGLVAGRFFSLEIKKPGETPTEEQFRWMRLVRSKGGFAHWCNNVQDALAAVERCRRGESE